MTDALHLTTVGGKRDIQSRVHVHSFDWYNVPLSSMEYAY